MNKIFKNRKKKLFCPFLIIFLENKIAFHYFKIANDLLRNCTKIVNHMNDRVTILVKKHTFIIHLRNSENSSIRNQYHTFQVFSFLFCIACF